MNGKVDSSRRDGRAIIVMGVSGSGKSTLGACIARTMGCRFLEGDSFHDPASVAKMRAGHPLSDADRWPWLDRIGEAANRATAQDGLVVAACSALRRVYRDRLVGAIAAPVSFLLLRTGREELSRRMKNRPGHYMPESLLDSQLATLELPAPDEPALVLDARTDPETLCREACAWLGTLQAAGPA